MSANPMQRWLEPLPDTGPLSKRPILVLVLLAALLRLPFLSRPPVDVDEAWTWYFGELAQSERGLLETFLIGLDGIVPVAMDILVLTLFGNDLTFLRLPAALCGIAAVPLAWATFRQLGGPRLGLVAAVLTTFSPFFVYYSMQARPYAHLLAGTLLFSWAAAGPASERSRRGLLAVAAAASVAVASHYYALVFLGTWYGLRLGAAAIDRRYKEAWLETREGLLVLLALTPLWLLLTRRLGSLGMGYWQQQGFGLAEIWTEEVLLIGTVLGGGHGPALLGAFLILLPFGVVAWRKPRLFIEQPWLLIGPGMPILSIVGGILLGSGSILFYPRGYIGSTPFLLAALAVLTPVAFPAAALRRGYAGFLLAIFLISTGFATIASPRHPYYDGREVLTEIAENINALRPRYDVVVVHQYMLAQFIAYYHPEPERVMGLGLFDADAVVAMGELPAMVQALKAVPAWARVLFVENALATQGTDRDGVIRAKLAERRPLLETRPCRENRLPGEEIFCETLYLFGSEDGAAAGSD